jgi:hypothetical protein
MDVPSGRWCAVSIPVYNPGPADWRHLDREAAAELWIELRPWVEWLRRRYDLGSQILSCWFKHDPLVEELTAAMWAHREVYQQLKKNPYHGGLSAWHYQVLWPLVHRIPTMAGFDECRNEVCDYAPTEPVIADDFAEFMAYDTDGRPERTEQPATSTATALTMDQVIEMIDSGSAVAEDPSDDFTAVDIEGTRWEFDDESETYLPVE